MQSSRAALALVAALALGCSDNTMAHVPIYTHPNPPTSVQPTPRASIPHGAVIQPVGTSITVREWYCSTFIAKATAAGATIQAAIGTAGGKMADIIAAWPTVTAAEPFDVLIEEGNINDIIAGTDPAVQATEAAQLISLGNATGASVKIWLGAYAGPLTLGEDPTQFGNAFNLALDQQCAMISALCAAAGWTYIDTRDYVKNWEHFNNPTNLGQGLLTVDGVHPNPGAGVQTLGTDVIGRWALDRVLFL